MRKKSYWKKRLSIEVCSVEKMFKLSEIWSIFLFYDVSTEFHPRLWNSKLDEKTSNFGPPYWEVLLACLIFMWFFHASNSILKEKKLQSVLFLNSEKKTSYHKAVAISEVPKKVLCHTLFYFSFFIILIVFTSERTIIWYPNQLCKFLQTYWTTK